MRPLTNLLAVGGCADCFIAAAAVGVVLAAVLTPLVAPGPRLLGRFFIVLGVVWLALAAILDVNHHTYAPH